MDSSAGTIHLLGFLDGTRQVPSASGIVRYEGLSFDSAGELRLRVCLWTTAGCEKDAITSGIQVSSGELHHVVFLSSNQSTQYHWKQNSHTPTGVVGNEPFQIAARLTDSLDNTVNLSLPVQVRAHGKNESGHEDANLLTGATSVVSKQGIAEFQLSFTGKAGAYYLSFTVMTDSTSSGNDSIIEALSQEFHVEPAVARLDFVTVPSPSPFVGNDILYPYLRVRLLDADGNLVTNSALSLRIEMLREAGVTPDEVQVIGEFIASPDEGSSGVVEFRQIATTAPLTVGGPQVLKWRVSTLTEQTQYASIESKSQEFVVRFPGSMKLIQEDSLPIGFGPERLPSPVTVKAGEWFGKPLNLYIRDDVVDNTDITGSQRVVTARIQNLTACNPYSQFCLDAAGGRLSGITEVSAVNGIASFTQLRTFFSGKFSLIFESRIFGTALLQVRYPTPLSVSSATYSKLSVHQEPNSTYEDGDRITTPPIILAMDQHSNVFDDEVAEGNIVEATIGDQNLEKSRDACWSYQSESQAPLSNKIPPKHCAQLFRPTDQTMSTGSIAVALESGVARFNCLAVTRTVTDLTLRFTDLTWGGEMQPMLWVESSRFSVYASDAASLEVSIQPSQNPLACVGQAFGAIMIPTIAIKDRHRNFAKVDDSIDLYASVSLDVDSQALDTTFFDFQQTSVQLRGTLSAKVRDMRAEFVDIFVYRALRSARLRFDVGAFFAYSLPFSVVHAPNVDRLLSLVSPADSLQNERLSPPPSVVLLDQFNNTVTSIHYFVSVSLVWAPVPDNTTSSICDGSNDNCTDKCLELAGVTQVVSKGGIASFPNLELRSLPGSYRLLYLLGAAQSESESSGSLEM
ncbi:MAG: hypothetical protein ACPIOQ_06265, partial [Promethearchaeia archaeon]